METKKILIINKIFKINIKIIIFKAVILTHEFKITFNIQNNKANKCKIHKSMYKNTNKMI